MNQKTKNKIISLVIINLLFIGASLSAFMVGFYYNELDNIENNKISLDKCLFACHGDSLQFEVDGIEIAGFYDFACNNGCYSRAMGILNNN